MTFIKMTASCTIGFDSEIIVSNMTFMIQMK